MALILQKPPEPEESTATGEPPAFDFERRSALSPAHVDLLNRANRAFSRTLAATLSAYLNVPVTLRAASFQEIEYSGFTAGLSSPTCLAALQMAQSPGGAVLECSLPLVYSVLDLVLGGNGQLSAPVERELTDIEQSLFEPVLRVVAEALTRAWAGVLPLSFRPGAIHSDPSLARFLDPQERLAVSVFELELAGNSGRLQLALPAQSLERGGGEIAEAPARAETSMADLLLSRAQVDLEFRIGGPEISVADLLDLRVGDLIELGSGLEGSVECLVNGASRFHGRMSGRGRQRVFEVQSLDGGARAAEHPAPAIARPALIRSGDH